MDRALTGFEMSAIHGMMEAALREGVRIDHDALAGLVMRRPTDLSEWDGVLRGAGGRDG